ncbi:hypothetical protein [Tellurirhabdus rosea]|uniref:hypothetical protein n=1 Tax=Tellurirhabdus rosea TaxID=2674997 RepID=UPI0022563AEB|nr:hypothetical protein [Tellurirhabdus rosea]
MNPAHEEIALCLTDWIAQGTRFPLSGTFTPPRHVVHHLALVAGKFFDKHPELLTDDVLESLAAEAACPELQPHESDPELTALRQVLQRFALSLAMPA